MSEIGEDIEEAKTAVTYAWKHARNLAPSTKKGGAKRVDIKEFHAFIVAFRYYLELAEVSEYLDSRQEEDQRLSLRECRKGLDRLQQWNIGEEELQEKFAGKEAWRPVIKFAD